jgi:hypothetical protein
MSILLICAVLGANVLPAFILGSLKAGSPPWTRHFWES